MLTFWKIIIPSIWKSSSCTKRDWSKFDRSFMEVHENNMIWAYLFEKWCLWQMICGKRYGFLKKYTECMVWVYLFRRRLRRSLCGIVINWYRTRSWESSKVMLFCCVKTYKFIVRVFICYGSVFWVRELKMYSKNISNET